MTVIRLDDEKTDVVFVDNDEIRAFYQTSIYNVLICFTIAQCKFIIFYYFNNQDFKK